ncbi:nuclear receptor coactivator 7 isoform X4 [Melanerpes formicivorus]|uniref:nuclear receptor coactivator 7 isoform X4 n=1 Tax=Melanerpes formicivorus TaxID=211600 RepID=UPI00358ED834
MMETKEEKKERRQGYFARLKKKRQAKPNPEAVSANSPASPASKASAEKDEERKVILEQISSSEDNCKLAGEKETAPDKEKKKKKYNQLKDIRRTELKRYYSTDDNQNKTNEKKEKKMVSQKPHGTIEYTAGNQDTINSIALKFNITPNKLVELNKLFTQTIVPGQILFVPETSAARRSSFSPGAPVSPSSSDAEYDKLPDADLARKAFKPVERVLSSTSEEDEPVVVKFLKMNCRYFTDGKGVVGGVMIVTPNNIMFDPHKSDPLVIENGCEEYGLICPMEEVVSIALYNDISHMKIKDALPSVDHLYTFFVQWSPEIYGKDAKEQGFVVVEKEELDMIDNFFSEPTTKSWEIITVEEAKRRKSVCSYYEEEDDDTLPVLKHHSALLENMHIEQLARRLPARVQGYPWRLAYSTLEHGTSLKTLYRKSASLDSPVLLVIKDMDNQIFGAYATHPFRFSDHYYGTGETFLYTFSPNFKVFKWSGENTYFINGDTSSLELGGGGGRFGLWLDADLYHGRSNSCSTFNNDILSKKEDFIIQDVEVWTFE